MAELRGGSREGALRGKSADMELVKHDVVPLPPRPGFPPAVRARVYRLARTVDVIRLKARRRIGNAFAAR